MRPECGRIGGSTAGSVLAVHPPHGDPRDQNEVIGYIRVDRSLPLTADVTPCNYGDKLPVSVEKLHDGARCEIVSRDFGDMRMKLYAD